MEVIKVEVTIIVKNGMIQEVYAMDKNIMVEVIDLDTTDDKEFEKLENEANRIRKEQYCIW